MRILLLQLSDIHIQPVGNTVAERRDRIVAAVRNLEPEARVCLVLFTGDLVNTGAEAEYSVAACFVDDLVAGLRGGLPSDCEVHVVMIPGNHDCDLSEDNLAREMLRTQVLAAPDRPVDASVIDICTGVQRSFFELRDLSSSSTTLFHKNNLYWVYTFEVDGEAVEVRCLNSAWLSKRHEAEGTLHYPVEIIDDRNKHAALAITLLHHPFAWYNTLNRRQLQKRLEEVSDMVFTGHEHAESRRTQVVSTGETNQFIEGAALQTAVDPNESSFNAVVIDTVLRKQRFLRFEWGADLYVPASRSDCQDFQANRLRTRGEFELGREFAAFLSDPGAGFEKANFGRPTLDQLFVEPDLRKVSLLKKSDATQPLGVAKLLDSTFDTPNVLISASDQAGKTCLAKWIFARCKADGLVPLFIDGSDFVPQRGDRLLDQLYRRFGTQYETEEEAEERFRQLERTRRVLIIDNFHRIRVAEGRGTEFVDGLDRFAGRVFLLTNDLVHALGEIVRTSHIIEGRSSYSHYRLMPFGHAKRMELTTRWLRLGSPLEDDQFAHRLAEADDKIGTVLGKNFVPAYPIFLLAMLQGLDSGAQSDFGGSAYGYFYEILIRTTLARESRQDDFNIRLGWLTWLGGWMFENGRTDITEDELKGVHASYAEKFDVKRRFGDLVADFERRLVLVRDGGKYRFKYKYYEYYVVARHLSQMISKQRGEALPRLQRLAADLASEENANILLFLAHLTDDDLVVSLLVERAKSQFQEFQVARLDEDVDFLTQFAPVGIDVEYEERPYAENRLALAKQRDTIEWNTAEHEASVEHDEGAAQREYEELQAILDRYIAGLKTLQLLGQLLKNFPGTIDASVKETMAVECYSLGFRALEGVLAMIREGRDTMVVHAAQTIRHESEDLEHEKIMIRANNVVFALALLAAFGIIKRISSAVGSPELERTYDKVGQALPFTATRLTNMAIRLDQVGGFPEDDLIAMAASLAKAPLPASVLRWLVLNHVTLFPVPFRERQSVFEAVGIKYAESIGANPNRRLLGPNTKTDASKE